MVAITQRLAWLAGFSLIFCAALATTGCRTSTDDVHRWANRSQGPRRLIAVVTHEKFDLDLRLEAIKTLIQMKPRKGRRIGLEGGDETPGVIDALAQLPPAERSSLMAKLVPLLQEQLALVPAAPPEGGQAADASIPFKDAAFLLLTHEEKGLLDPQSRASLRAALAKWCVTNFAQRMDDTSQLFGVEQVLKELKNEGVQFLPALIEPGAPKIDRIAQLIADLGDQKTREEASQRLVTVAERVNSSAWIEEQRPKVDAANKLSKLTPTPKQFDAQLAQFQDEELVRVFSSMKRVGGSPVAAYLLGYAQNTSNDPKRRAGALAALEGNVDRNSLAQADALLAIAGSDDTPDMVRQGALARVGELPRKLVVDKLFKLFENRRWQERWVAAELVLKMSDANQLGEFMTRIGRVTEMALSEPLQYGSLIGDLRGPPAPLTLVQKYAAPGNPVPVRLSALGYYYRHGDKGQVADLAAYARDTAAVPSCPANAEDCEWKCAVAGEPKEVKTLGDYVEYCLKPALEGRVEATPEPKKG
jgi:hypothetical protein